MNIIINFNHRYHNFSILTIIIISIFTFTDFFFLSFFLPSINFTWSHRKKYQQNAKREEGRMPKMQNCESSCHAWTDKDKEEEFEKSTDKDREEKELEKSMDKDQEESWKGQQWWKAKGSVYLMLQENLIWTSKKTGCESCALWDREEKWTKQERKEMWRKNGGKKVYCSEYLAKR